MVPLKNIENVGSTVTEVGLTTEPLDVGDPASPRNRRLSIVLLRGTGDQKLPDGDHDSGESGQNDG